MGGQGVAWHLVGALLSLLHPTAEWWVVGGTFSYQHLFGAISSLG